MSITHRRCPEERFRVSSCLCTVVMGKANQAIIRERHQMPTVEELTSDLNGAKIFSKIDLTSSYHQLKLTTESRSITTLNTHVGLFRYKRLNFGISSASEIFYQTIRNVIHDIPNAKNISDDIIVFGTTQEQHDKTSKLCSDACMKKD